MARKIAIKNEIKARALSQAEVARRARISESDMSKIARGLLRPYPAQAKRIAAALDWHGDPMELFSETDEMEV